MLFHSDLVSVQRQDVRLLGLDVEANVCKRESATIPTPGSSLKRKGV